jgi:lysophospholipase L1-like esterase
LLTAMENKQSADAPDVVTSPADPWPSGWGRLARWAAFFVCMALVAEGAARVAGAISKDPVFRLVLHDYGRLARGDASRFRFVPDADLPYRLKPGFEQRSPGGLQVTRHNQAGFRANDDFAPKEPGVLRIICLGGSTTYGVSVADNNATYPAVLEQLLNNEPRVPGVARVEVLNLGVGGYNSREVLANFEHHGSLLEPDVVLIQSAVNDVTPRLYPGFRADYGHFRKPLQPVEPGPAARAVYRSQLLVIAGWKLGLLDPLTLQARSQYPMPTGAEAVANLADNDPEAYRANIAEVVRAALDAGARVWLLTQAHLFDTPGYQAPDEDSRLLDTAYSTGLTEHNQILRDLALETGAGLVDLERDMPLERRYFSDPVHMTEAGNRVKARIIAETLRPEL